MNRTQTLFLDKSIQRALTAIAEGRLKPNLEASDGHMTVYLDDSGYTVTCRILAPGEQGARSANTAFVARLEPPLGPPPY